MDYHFKNKKNIFIFHYSLSSGFYETLLNSSVIRYFFPPISNRTMYCNGTIITLGVGSA